MTLDGYLLPCLNKKLFGIECLGCGLQRSLVLVFQGEFSAAFNMYPAIYTLLLLGVLITVNALKILKISNKTIVSLTIINFLIIITSYCLKLFY